MPQAIQPQKSIRLLGRPTSFFQKTAGYAGEIYFDSDIGALRVYRGGNALLGKVIADRDWVTSQLGEGGGFSGDYNDLINRPTIPAFATVASSGDYNDLSNKPIIPTRTSDLTNNSNFVTNSALSIYALSSSIPTNTNQLTNGAGFITNSALSTYATQSYVTTQIADFATESYVDTQISNIDYSSYATQSWVTGLLLSETIGTKTGASGIVVHDITAANVWKHTSVSADFTANITNVPTTNNKVTNVVLILTQGVTPYLPTALQIAGTAQTINWQGAEAPTGTANQLDIVSFSLIRASDAWTVLGSLSTYG